MTDGAEAFCALDAGLWECFAGDVMGREAGWVLSLRCGFLVLHGEGEVSNV